MGFSERKPRLVLVLEGTKAVSDGSVWCDSTPSFTRPQLGSQVIAIPSMDWGRPGEPMTRAWWGTIEEIRRTPKGNPHRWQIRVRMVEPLPPEAFTGGIVPGSGLPPASWMPDWTIDQMPGLIPFGVDSIIADLLEKQGDPGPASPVAQTADQSRQSIGPTPVTQEFKTCPDCAEQVRHAARKCRFCGYMFED